MSGGTQTGNNFIEKPWAVYGWDVGSYGIGRIAEERAETLQIIYSEKEKEYHPWKPQ